MLAAQPIVILGTRQPEPDSMLDNAVAMPRNEKNPATSVTVVRTIDEATAGSWPSLERMIGTNAPAIPAATMEMTMDNAMTTTGQCCRSKDTPRCRK